MTKTHKKRVEEIVSYFEDIKEEDFVSDWLRTTLLTLRREMLEDRVKRMEGILTGKLLHDTFLEVKGYDGGTPFDDLDEQSIKRYNLVAFRVLQTILEADQDREELLALEKEV